MIISSGVGSFDRRVGGLSAGGLYLLAGAPGSGKLAFLLHFLVAGLEADERVAFLGGHAPDELFEQAKQWGMDALEGAWRQGRLTLLGYRGEYPRRILQAADPEEAFDELTGALAGPVHRLAVDPGTLLWETRAGTAMAATFLQWQQAADATVAVTAVTDLGKNLPDSTQWVVQQATGVFHLERLRNGLRELRVHRARPPAADPGPITLELRVGVGLVPPAVSPGRRIGDVPREDRRRLFLLRLTDAVGEDLERWIAREYEMHQTRDHEELLSRLRLERRGSVCIAVERSRVDEAIRLCQTLRDLTPGAIVLLSRGQLRSSDRARAMEAGANDVLRQDVVLREIQSRFRRAAAGVAGDYGALGDPVRPRPIRELVEPPAFSSEVEHRLDSPSLGYLTMLLVSGEVGLEVLAALRESARIEAGDFVGRVPGGYGVVLQDARARHARIYLGRALGGLEPGEAPEVRILTSPEEADEIRAALGS